MFKFAHSDLVFIQGETKNHIDNAESIITEVTRGIIQSNYIDQFELRLGLIGTHHPQDKAHPEVCYYSFMSDVSQFRHCLGQLQPADEGLRTQTFALYTALKMRWRENCTKMVILITDSPPHEVEEDEDEGRGSVPKGNSMWDKWDLIMSFLTGVYIF